ncbi:MAG: hypothetical protein K2Z81_20955 [Cyanobacteria bacterium]|nr:hypothetical protein [Cyanobacteriota bacterium]
MQTIETGRPTGAEIVGSKVFAMLGRILLAISCFALIQAWVVPVFSGTILGMSQQLLFTDAIILALLGCGFLLDAGLHSRGI